VPRAGRGDVVVPIDECRAHSSRQPATRGAGPAHDSISARFCVCLWVSQSPRRACSHRRGVTRHTQGCSKAKLWGLLRDQGARDVRAITPEGVRCVHPLTRSEARVLAAADRVVFGGATQRKDG
jgi:hypothetical protein